jgi:transcriptional regulator with AAA-type ATPase domain
MEKTLKLELNEREIEKIIDDSSYILIILAKNKDLDNKYLQKLAQKKDFFIKSNVAQNPNIVEIPELVERFANDKSASIRCSLASNPKIFQYPEITQKLLKDKDASVVKFLYFNAQEQKVKLNFSL